MYACVSMCVPACLHVCVSVSWLSRESFVGVARPCVSSVALVAIASASLPLPQSSPSSSSSPPLRHGAASFHFCSSLGSCPFAVYRLVSASVSRSFSCSCVSPVFSFVRFFCCVSFFIFVLLLLLLLLFLLENVHLIAQNAVFDSYDIIACEKQYEKCPRRQQQQQQQREQLTGRQKQKEIKRKKERCKCN